MLLFTLGVLTGLAIEFGIVVYMEYKLDCKEEADRQEKLKLN